MWLHAYLANRAAEKEAADARMQLLLRERDKLADQCERLPPAERGVVTEQIAGITAEIAAVLGPERKPPRVAAQWGDG
jgi:hypothetical protein